MPSMTSNTSGRTTPKGMNTNGVRNNMASLSKMTFQEKKALADSPVKVTLKWTDQHSPNAMTVNNIPKPMPLAFSPVAKELISTSGGNTRQHSKAPSAATICDLGEVPDLVPAAVCYVTSALAAACRSREAGAMPKPFPEPADVEKQLKCFVAAKRLGLARYIQRAWRGAVMDAVGSAGRVAFKEFAYLYGAFGDEEEVALLKHVLNVVVYAEMTDGEVHPDTLAINRFVYGGQPPLAVMKKGLEVQMEKKLSHRARKEAREQSSRDFLEREARREAGRQKRLDMARNGERALTDAEVDAMGTYTGPTVATISSKLRQESVGTRLSGRVMEC